MMYFIVKTKAGVFLIINLYTYYKFIPEYKSIAIQNLFRFWVDINIIVTFRNICSFFPNW